MLPGDLKAIEVHVDAAVQGNDDAVEAAGGHEVEAVGHVVHEVGVEGRQLDALVPLMRNIACGRGRETLACCIWVAGQIIGSSREQAGPYGRSRGGEGLLLQCGS